MPTCRHNANAGQNKRLMSASWTAVCLYREVHGGLRPSTYDNRKTMALTAVFRAQHEPHSSQNNPKRELSQVSRCYTDVVRGLRSLLALIYY